jgi:excisionase family DNA binding protein
MTFTAAELAEIRLAFRRRLAADRPPRKPRPKPKPKSQSKPQPLPVLVREPDHDDDSKVLWPGEVADLFAVSVRTVRRWADAGTLPSFRTDGGHRRFRWGELRAAVEPPQAQL